MSENHHGAAELSAGLSVEAAGFENTFYVGNYQGVAASASWMGSRFGAGATVGVYHLTENGRSMYGFGDAMVGGHAMALATDTWHAGVALHMMFPTGAENRGFGMGHVMAMPSAWAMWHAHPVAVLASAGYGRALTSLGGESHDHGSALIDPMNMEELTWSAGADLDAGHRVRVGGRARGGIPIGAGTTRVVGAGRVAWGTSRLSTALEVQLGLAGDPFTVRGVVETALRF